MGRPSVDDLKHYEPRDKEERAILDLVLARLPAYPDFASLKYHELDHLLELGQYHLAHGLKIGTAQGDVSAGINTNVSNDALGLVPDPNVTTEQGTMESGIIAAVRNNGKGIDGVADRARIMMLKMFNNIREMRNNDLAAAIRYAVDQAGRLIAAADVDIFLYLRSHEKGVVAISHLFPWFAERPRETVWHPVISSLMVTQPLGAHQLLIAAKKRTQTTCSQTFLIFLYLGRMKKALLTFFSFLILYFSLYWFAGPYFIGPPKKTFLEVSIQSLICSIFFTIFMHYGAIRNARKLAAKQAKNKSVQPPPPSSNK